jgi:glycosyltransferase involved in cell wall biosynthesis
MSLDTSPNRLFDDALVSIVIPCFNQAHYLGEAIQSALALTHSRTQIVVVDDGSTDNTAEVARSYSKVVYIYQSNQGVGAARNTGFHASAGEFVIFLDHDDRLLPNAIEAGLNCFQKYPDSGFVFGRYRKIDGAGKIISDPTQSPDERDFYLALLQRNPIGHPAVVLHRRDVLEKIGGFETAFKGSCDYHLYLRIAQSFPVHKHDGIVAEYRWHEGNASWNYRYMLENTLCALRTQSLYTSRTPLYQTAMKKGLSNWRNHYGRLMLYDLRTHWKAHGLDRGSIDRFRTLVYCYPQGFASLAKSVLRSIVHRAQSDRTV